MANTKLSALTELTTDPNAIDEFYIRDESELPVSESKRILFSTLKTAVLNNITSLNIDQINITGNNISTNLTNADLQLTPNGTGLIEFFTSGLKRWLIDSSGTLFPNANNTLDIGSTAVKVREGFFVTVSATYADIAERYEADSEYEPGTVMIFGGDKEITQSTIYNDSRVAGIISTNPGYKMNEDAGPDKTHPYMSLTGRVPCKVIGLVRKGDLMITSSYPGVAMAKSSGSECLSGIIIGKSLENYNDNKIGIIEVVVGIN